MDQITEKELYVVLQRMTLKIVLLISWTMIQGVGEKLGGLTEEVKGKVLKKPEVVQHGHDRRTGELKKKEEDAAVSLVSI